MYIVFVIILAYCTYMQVSKLKSQLEKLRAHLRNEHKMEIATLKDKVRTEMVILSIGHYIFCRD